MQLLGQFRFGPCGEAPWWFGQRRALEAELVYLLGLSYPAQLEGSRLREWLWPGAPPGWSANRLSELRRRLERRGFAGLRRFGRGSWELDADLVVCDLWHALEVLATIRDERQLLEALTQAPGLLSDELARPQVHGARTLWEQAHRRLSEARGRWI